MIQTAIMRTRNLRLRLLRAVVLGEDRRGDDGESSEELKRSKVQHSSGTGGAIRFGR